MFGKKSVETLVIGAGPAGMTAALALAQNGIETAIIDFASRSCSRSNALLLHPKTLKLYSRLGFIEKLLEVGYRNEKILFYDDTQPREVVKINELPTEYPYALTIPQWELESILEEELERVGIRVLWNHRASVITPQVNGYTVDVDRYCESGTGYAVSHTERVIDKTLHFDTRFVLAADGYNSLTRRLLRTEQKTMGTSQYYAFFDIETDMDPQHAIRVSFKNKLATAQYSMTGGIARLSFQYTGLDLPPENRNKDRELLQNRLVTPAVLDDSYLKQLIDMRVPWVTGYINRIKYRAVVPFEKRYLPNPYENNLFFVGDAARSFGPLSMTSVNLAVQEAELVANAYRRCKELGNLTRTMQQLGESMTYRWRGLADIENRCIPIEMADPWVAGNRARILRALPATGENLERLASQLFIHLNSEELVHS